MPSPASLRKIPSVASLLALDDIRSLLACYPRTVILEAIRRILDGYRNEALRGEGGERTREDWTALLLAALPAEVAAGEEISFRRVINATGVVVHTNLGRAPLPEEAIRAISDTASGYSNLEFDLGAGTRSSRAWREGGR
jgi:L-seryl-tRNA(Ser) seleniumtransferase